LPKASFPSIEIVVRALICNIEPTISEKFEKAIVSDKATQRVLIGQIATAIEIKTYEVCRTGVFLGIVRRISCHLEIPEEIETALSILLTI